MTFPKPLIAIAFFVIGLMGCAKFQTSHIFFPQTIKQDFKYSPVAGIVPEEVFINEQDSTRINELFFKGSSGKVILYFHGNAGGLDSWQYIYKYYHDLDINFLIIDYRGYGKSTGNITEEGLYSDGKASYDYLVSKGFVPDSIIVLGRSIGTGIATDLASKYQVGALILESPFADFEALVKHMTSASVPSVYKFKNLEKINSIKCPLLVIHGKKDELIDFSNGQKIFEAYQGKKQFLPIEDGTHNNLPDFPEYGQAIKLFISGIDKK